MKTASAEERRQEKAQWVWENYVVWLSITCMGGVG